jgi:hypothetical protein
MQPYNVIPGWIEGPDLESQEENFFDSGFGIADPGLKAAFGARTPEMI